MHHDAKSLFPLPAMHACMLQAARQVGWLVGCCFWCVVFWLPATGIFFGFGYVWQLLLLASCSSFTS